jgi:integrase
MPAYKDEQRGTWYVSFYYTDWKGQKKLKKKRGFARKKDALEYEREFLAQQTQSCDMLFSSFVQLYLEYGEKRDRVSTQSNKRELINKHILPYFGGKKLNDIKATDIHHWQNEMISAGYRPTYLRSLHSRISATFNYAVRFYDLPQNPCQKAGIMGSKKPETIDFWTLDEYRTFIPFVADKPRSKVGFDILYWAGLRIGELLALTPADYLKDKMSLRVNKTWQMVDGQELIGPPKTAAGNRIVPIPEFLGKEIEEYMSRLYECPEDERIFLYATKSFFAREITRGCKASGVKKIRVHDVRHSHVSLLINLGYDFMLIAERIGHEDIKYIMETYGHLYPEKHSEVVQRLEEIHA